MLHMITIENNKVFWKNRKLKYKDFVEVREYIDTCLDPNLKSKFKQEVLTVDSGLLIRLIDEMIRLIPHEVIPPSPKLVQLNEETSLMSGMHQMPISKNPPDNELTKKQKKQLQHWKSEFAYASSRLKGIQLELKELIKQKNSELKQLYKKEKKSFESEYEERFKKVEKYNFQRKIMKDRKKVINSKSFNGFLVRKINWKILPPGKKSAKRLKMLCEEMNANNHGKKYEWDRLKRLFDLNPNQILTGENDFKGYFLFCYTKEKIAVAECPEVGNALFVLKENWKSLCQYSKSELKKYFSEHSHRIVHKGDWFSELRYYLIRCGVSVSKL